MITATYQEPILASISNLKIAHIATMSYWTIVLTDKAIYFVRTGTAIGLGVETNTALMAVSVLGDVMASKKANVGSAQTIEGVLESSESFLRFTKEQLSSLEYKKGIFKGKIVVPNGKEKSIFESGRVVLKMWPKKFGQFISMVERLRAL